MSQTTQLGIYDYWISRNNFENLLCNVSVCIKSFGIRNSRDCVRR